MASPSPCTARIHSLANAAHAEYSDRLLMKAKLRKELRARRRFLEDAQYALRSKRAASAITRLTGFKAGARVAAYLPFDREADTAALLYAARRRGVRIFVPVDGGLPHRPLRFQPLSATRRRG